MKELQVKAFHRVAANADCKSVMYILLGMNEVDMKTMDLWLKMQAYHFFMEQSEAAVVDKEAKSWAERLRVTPEAYKAGLPVLVKNGFIQPLSKGRTRLLTAGEVITMRGRQQGWFESELAYA